MNTTDIVRENVCNKAKKNISHVFEKKTVKVITRKVLETIESVFFPVSIKLLRPYFNQQFYIMLYVYVFISERTV